MILRQDSCARQIRRYPPALMAVTSISIFTSSLISLAENIVVADLFCEKYLLSTGQHFSNSLASGRM